MLDLVTAAHILSCTFKQVTIPKEITLEGISRTALQGLEGRKSYSGVMVILLFHDTLNSIAEIIMTHCSLSDGSGLKSYVMETFQTQTVAPVYVKAG